MPHQDCYGSDSPRVLTVLYYCNPDWQPSDGGQLRIHKDGGMVEVEPKSGRIVILYSSEVVHEILEVKRGARYLNKIRKIEPNENISSSKNKKFGAVKILTNRYKYIKPLPASAIIMFQFLDIFCVRYSLTQWIWDESHEWLQKVEDEDKIEDQKSYLPKQTWVEGKDFEFVDPNAPPEPEMQQGDETQIDNTEQLQKIDNIEELEKAHTEQIVNDDQQQQTEKSNENEKQQQKQQEQQINSEEDFFAMFDQMQEENRLQHQKNKDQQDEQKDADQQSADDNQDRDGQQPADDSHQQNNAEAQQH